MDVRKARPKPETADPAQPRRGLTQAQRRTRSRTALLESAARGLSRHGYGNLRLEAVARDAGYSRGAIYHQFADKEDLALAVIDWVDEAWALEVGEPARLLSDPVDELLAIARGHAAFCRRDVAGVVTALRVEFSGEDHAVGRRLRQIADGGVRRIARLVEAGRRDGSIPAGPAAPLVAGAFLGALEGTVIEVAGSAPDDELLAMRACAGVLGIPTA